MSEKQPPETPESQFKQSLEAKLPVGPAKNTALSFAFSSQASSKNKLLEALNTEILRLEELLKQNAGRGQRIFASPSYAASPFEAVYQKLHQLRRARELVDLNL